MSYSKNTWNNGDVITKTKLDNIENGIYNNAVTHVAVNNGVASFKNADNTELFTLTLPDGSSYTKIGEKEYSASTTSTTAVLVGTFYVDTPSDLWTSANIIYITIRDKAGKRAGYFYGNDAWFVNSNPSRGITSAYTTPARYRYTCDQNGDVIENNTTTPYGVYIYDIANDGRIRVYARYNSNGGTTDGTYKIEVYSLKFPNNVSPFA